MKFKTRYGIVDPMKVYVDPSREGGDTAVLVGYKAKNSGFDSAAFYCPYIPLQMHETLAIRRKKARAADSRRWWNRLFG